MRHSLTKYSKGNHRKSTNNWKKSSLLLQHFTSVPVSLLGLESSSVGIGLQARKDSSFVLPQSHHRNAQQHTRKKKEHKIRKEMIHLEMCVNGMVKI